jgi:hypothetical protein
VSGYIFLVYINQVLSRLAAMLPDQTLRLETRSFAAWNTWMLAAALAGLSVEIPLTNFPVALRLPGSPFLGPQRIGEWLILFLTLTAVAVTLALLWKIKEAIFTSLFELER